MDFAEFLASTSRRSQAHPLSTTRSCCGPSSLNKYTLHTDMSKWPSPGARARCFLYCVQSPGPAMAGGIPRGSDGSQAVANYLCRSRRTHSNYLCRSRRPGVHTQLPTIYVRGSLRGRIYEGWGRPQGLRLAVANIYMCTSGRLYVHTQLPIIYVGTHTITNCLCRWEPSAAPYSWCIPHPLPSEPRAGEGGGRPRGLGRQAGRCLLFVWVGPSSRTHTIANYLCRYTHNYQLFMYVGASAAPYSWCIPPRPPRPRPRPPPSAAC